MNLLLQRPEALDREDDRKKKYSQEENSKSPTQAPEKFWGTAKVQWTMKFKIINLVLQAKSLTDFNNAVADD